jgi:hypothetical protein
LVIEINTEKRPSHYFKIELTLSGGQGHNERSQEPAKEEDTRAHVHDAARDLYTHALLLFVVGDLFRMTRVPDVVARAAGQV